MFVRALTVLSAVAALGAFGSANAGTLIAATDGFVFGGVPGSEFSVSQTSGTSVGPQTITDVNFGLNGIGAGPGYLFGGDPETSDLYTLDYNGNVLSHIVAPGVPNGCCNEQYAYVDGTLYHAFYSSFIQSLDPVTGNQLSSSPQDSIVGITQVGSQIWISDWSSGDVGTWDPGTNTFTPVFNAGFGVGALAWDSEDGILWAGNASGLVVPYSLTGTQLGAGFDPFDGGNPGGTIDGLAFISSVPEPASIGLLAAGLAGLARARRRKI